jgi:hypothetical protein
MIESCEGLNDTAAAEFYLECQNWDLDGAVSLWLSENQLSQRQTPATNRQTTIYIILSGKGNEVLHDNFDSESLIFSIFPLVYSSISEQKQVIVRVGSASGVELTIETMTTQTFAAGGYTPTATFFIEEV